MNWISRFIVRIGSAFAALLLFQLLTAGAEAASPATYIYQDQSITFTNLARGYSESMVGINDPGLRTLLRDVGAVVTWKPGERYVLITTTEPVVISFSVGDRRYDVGPLSAQAATAPYLDGDEVYLPLDELLRALYLAPKRDGAATVLQPQLASIDVRGTGAQATLIARGGSNLQAHLTSDAPDRVVYEFDGVGSSLPPLRQVNAGGVRMLQISSSGTVREPKTIVTVFLQPNARHGAPESNNGDFEVAFSGAGSAVAAAPPVAATAPPASPLPQETEPAAPAPTASAAVGGATVTAVTAGQTADGGVSVTVTVTGNAAYEWHRLREPDNRFWVDIKGAQLQIPPIDQAEADPVVSLRVRQIDAQTVRIALSLTGPKDLSVSPSSTGLNIQVGTQDVADAAHSGAGSVGSVVSVNEPPQTLVTPAPIGEPSSAAAPEEAWKFGPRSSYVPANPKLIIIDPGHGGSDRGASRDGLDEATLTLDMAKRLRAILISQGWQVQMTRTTDVDVFQPNDTAHQELQARDDIANNAGARLLISIHCNAFINSGPRGTTTYYSKPIDEPFAQIIDQSMAQSLGTKDDGIVKSHLYITLHSYMPAVLIETAFLSNPDDFARLNSSDWRQKAAQAMADGINRYTQEYPVQNGSGQ